MNTQMNTQIKLNNGTVLNAVQVNGSSIFYQNANRDSLEFVFDETHSMDTLVSIFNERDNTRAITIVQSTGEGDATEFAHNDYVLQVSVTRESVIIKQETSSAPAVTVPRIKVVMAQQTYTEKLVEELLSR